MADLIQRKGLSEAWVAAMELMLRRNGKAINMNVAFRADVPIEPAVTEIVDAFIKQRGVRHSDGNLLAVRTVANTIFPAALYRRHLGREAAPRLYENYALSMQMHRRRKGDKETYFNRLVAYPVGSTAKPIDNRLNPDGTWNQLDYYVRRLQRQRETLHRSSAYELGVSHPFDADLRIQAPFTDKRMSSFPCLSHISLTLEGNRVHMNATYRNQTLISRGYGNYVGLVDLLRFIGSETGVQPGEIQVVATHADAELQLGKKAVVELVARCRAQFNAMTGPVSHV